MKQAMTDARSKKIQVLRGAAIIAVVMIHNTPRGMMQVWFRPFINYSVGLFLFLSGMLSSSENWHPKNRIMKVIIPYIIWTFIYVLIYNYQTIPHQQLPRLFVKDLLTGRAAAVMYYVFLYCELNLLVPWIDKLARSRYMWAGFLISPLEIIIMRLIPLYKGQEVNHYVSIIMGVSCLALSVYFYLGYLLGNGLLELKTSTRILFLMWAGSMILQVLEGYWYLSMGEVNCGTQAKLTAVLTGVIVSLLAYKYVYSDTAPAPGILSHVGDYSFGIFFIHLAVMALLKRIPAYRQYMVFPFNAFVVIVVSIGCILVGKRLLGKYAKYFAF